MFLLALPTLLAAAAAAAPICGGPLDLDRALGLAAGRSDEVAIKQAEVTSAEADAALARALRILPMATLTAVVGPSPSAQAVAGAEGLPGGVLGNPRREDQTSNIWDWDRIKGLRPFTRVEVQLIQPIYTWGRLDAARDAAAAGLRARNDLVQDTTSQVQLRVHQLYWGISLAKRFLAIADDVTRALDDAAKRVKKALDEEDADVSPSDALKIDVFRGLVQGRTADAQKGLELARVGLAATLGLEPEELQLAEAPLDPSEGQLPDERQAVESAVRQRSDLRALDGAIAAREASVRAERGAMYPQLFLAGGITYAWAPNRQDPANPWVGDYFSTHGWPVPGITAGLRQDLSFPTLSAKVKKAEAEQAVLERQRAGLVRLVEVQVRSAVSELKAARARFVAARAAFGAARSLYRTAGLDFAAGLAETNDLIDAYKQYVENQVTAAQAAYDLLLARARLSQAAGEPPREPLTCDP